ncbi:hypothetical protein BRADO0648 [Bradyrhizobium sp. ORS 278]|nr:hypothetical protein BRADO0648 [Bradyrhizobium sp. ORS 278]
MAKRYRKVSRVLAFRSDDAFSFQKPWGVQQLPEGSWIIIPLSNGQPTGDIYGCNREAFVETYGTVDGDQPNMYEKHAIISAYQVGRPFLLRTIVAGYAETDPAIGGPTDWLVQNPGGEIYAVADIVFRATYRELGPD